MGKSSSNTHKIVRGVSSQALVVVVLGVVEIASFAIMSRLLTQEDFGYYAAVTAITVVFATFSETGIGSAIVQQKTLTSRYVNNAFTLSLIFGCFISFMLLVLAGPLSRYVADESMQVPLMLMSSTLLLHCLTSVNKSIMHRKLQFLRMGMIDLTSLVMTTVVAVWLAYEGLGYYAIITKAVLASIMTYLLSLYFCKTRFSWELDRATFNNIFKFSGWLMASSLFKNLAHQIDKLLMPSLLSVSALGAYNRPKEFVESISMRINGIFDTALFPVLSGIQDNPTVLKSAFHRSMYAMNLFASLLTLAFMFNSSLLIRIFFGEQWISLQAVMFVIASSLLFNIDGRLADCYLRSLAMTKQQFYFRIFETVLKTIGVIASYKFGILGIAVSIVITNLISKLIKILYIGVKIEVSPLQTIGIILSSWRYLLIFLPICIVAYIILPNSWIGNIGVMSIFVICSVTLFFFFPSFVGKQYKEQLYGRVVSFVKKSAIKYGKKNKKR